MMAATPISMPGPSPSPSAIIALCLAAGSAVLHVVAAGRLGIHLRRTGAQPPGPVPPLTSWRTVKPGVPELDRKLDALVASSRQEDQILLGADAGSAEHAACEALRARNPGRAIVVVPCEPNRAANPKISKFIQMAPFATHEHWLLTDSEAMLDAPFVEGFRSEWAASGADAQTAGYRFTGLRSAAQVLDAAPPLLTLWPGLMLVRHVRFTLGACNGVKADDVRAIGGWETLAGELAEDQHLGALLAGSGKRIRLSRHVITLDSDPPDWKAYMLHQHRAAVTYRAATPAGTLGLPLLHTPLLAAAAAVLHPAWWKWAALILVVRLVSAAWVSRQLRFPIPLLPITAIISAMVESAMWCAAWFSRSVWWSGRWRRIGWRGAMVERALRAR